MNKTIFLLAVSMFVFTQLWAQSSKPPLDYTVYDNWKSLRGQKISNNGKLISFEINPSVGDGVLYLKSTSNKTITSIPRGNAAVFSPDGSFLAYKIKVQADTIRQAKIEKVKKDKLPKDSLAVFMPESGNTLSWARLKSFAVPREGPALIAYQLEEEKKAEAKKEDEAKEGEEEEKEGEEKKSDEKKEKKKEYKGSELIVLDPKLENQKAFAFVTEYKFSKKGNVLYITSIEEDSLNRSEINIYDTEKNESKIIWDKAGVTKGLTSDEEGAQFAFYHSEDTAKTKVYSLYYWNAKMDDPELLVDSLTKGMPAGWVVSEKGRLSFSDDGKMLFLATGAKPEVESEEKDSLLADDKVHIDIWHWQDVVLQSMQLKRLSSEKNKTYKAVVHLKKKNFVQLAEKDFLESIRQVNLGHTTRGMASFDKPYELSNAVNFKSVKDIYLTDLTTGDDKMIFEAVEFSPAISTFGNYLYWWEPKDSNYYVYNIDKEKLVCLTEGMDVCFAQRGHDYPSDVGSYGSMGWAKDDESMYLYDEFDIWCFDPAGKNEPINITSGFGRENDLQLRYARLDPEEKFIHPEEDYVFRAFNIETKESGFYRFSLEEASLKKLVMEECGYRLMGKARDAEKLLWTKSTVTEYPDVWISDLSFQSAIKLSEANPQQGDYNWLSVELVEWLDYDGVRHQGLLYKPEDFDPAKKYPMMVYFYRLHSNSLYSHVYPRASSSTINAAFYASNGYLVFMPDVYFKIGQPGRSAFNSIVSGVMSLGKERDYIDMKNLGLQGQSWGGYQAAYIITQTDLFAAASPGAPVSNMTSAYGGIRTSSGMCRQVQYEKTQSRIGGSLWDKPLEYFENSPLFYANQCNTPCLIRHNDNDGAVPFAQGVEFFVALRRLGRPAWLLNYNNGPHNLTKKLSNRKDLSVRMKQFFDHYLMDEPAPAWLDEGVKAIDKKQSETFYMNYTK